MFKEWVDQGFYELWKKLPITVIFSSLVHCRVDYFHEATYVLR